MKAILKLDADGKNLGMFPLKDPGELKKEPTIRHPRMQAIAVDVQVFAPVKPKPIKFSVIGKKPGSQVVEELGVMTVGETFSIPAGTHVIKVERIREDDHVQDG